MSTQKFSLPGAWEEAAPGLFVKSYNNGTVHIEATCSLLLLKFVAKVQRLLGPIIATQAIGTIYVAVSDIDGVEKAVKFLEDMMIAYIAEIDAEATEPVVLEAAQ